MIFKVEVETVLARDGRRAGEPKTRTVAEFHGEAQTILDDLGTMLGEMASAGDRLVLTAIATVDEPFWRG